MTMVRDMRAAGKVPGCGIHARCRAQGVAEGYRFIHIPGISGLSKKALTAGIAAVRGR